MYTQRGVFRRFAFIGFSTPAEAAAAISYFDRTFVDTSRIEVMSSKAVGDPSIPRAWSRYSAGSSQNTATAERLKREAEERRLASLEKAKAEVERKRAFLASIYDAEQQDPDLARYLGATKSKSRTKTWENDDETLPTTPFPGNVHKQTGAKKNKKKRTEAAHVHVVPVANRKPGGEGLIVSKTHVTYSSDSDSGAESVREPVSGNEFQELSEKGGSSDDDLYEDLPPINSAFNADANSGSDSEPNSESGSEAGSNLDHTAEDVLDVDVDQGIVGDDMAVERPLDGVPKKKELTPDLISETARLFVRNLAFSCVSDDLHRLFEQFGPVVEVHLSLSRETKRPKGYAYVQFAQAEAALRAYRALDGSIFQGRLMHILPAEARPVSKAASEAAGTGSSYKKKRLEEQKSLAGNDFNWNSLFVRSDTVLQSIATQLGVSKAELMNPESESLAVRLATAESHLVADTKRALEDEGVELSVFASREAKKERSDRIILVKNLPFETDRSELSRLFSRHGPLGRVILPPSKAVALVEFLESVDAKTAFRAQAYAKFHDVPLFLEWAPAGILRAEEAGKADHSAVATRVIAGTVAETETDNDHQNLSMDSRTLYIKNINFETQEETLRAIFALEIGPVRSVTIPRKRDPRRPDAGLLSMGYAFVQFDRPEHVNLAIDRLQGYLVDGHALILKRSSATLSSLATGSGSHRASSSKRRTSGMDGDSRGTRLLVRNVPFEATEKEVRDLFRSFSEIRRVRLPRKFDGGHRGFAFVDFVNNQEAQNAMSSLAHTHLYGRHLVLEWAKEDPSTEELRSRSARNAGLLDTVPSEDLAIGGDRRSADANI